MGFTGVDSKVVQFLTRCGLDADAECLIGRRNLNYREKGVPDAAAVIGDLNHADSAWRTPVCLLAFTAESLIFTYDGLMVTPDRAADRSVVIPRAQVTNFSVIPDMFATNIQFDTATEHYKISVQDTLKQNRLNLEKLQISGYFGLI